jgi:hypothetical protein
VITLDRVRVVARHIRRCTVCRELLLIGNVLVAFAKSPA